MIMPSKTKKPSQLPRLAVDSEVYRNYTGGMARYAPFLFIRVCWKDGAPFKFTKTKRLELTSSW